MERIARMIVCTLAGVLACSGSVAAADPKPIGLKSPNPAWIRTPTPSLGPTNDGRAGLPTPTIAPSPAAAKPLGLKPTTALQAAMRTLASEVTAPGAELFGPRDLVFTANPAACKALGVGGDCASKLESGHLLFAWSCPNCDSTLKTRFVVQGQILADKEIAVSPSRTSALTVRPNQFGVAECVAIGVFHPTSGANSVSNAVCIGTPSVALAQAAKRTTLRKEEGNAPPSGFDPTRIEKFLVPPAGKEIAWQPGLEPGKVPTPAVIKKPIIGVTVVRLKPPRNVRQTLDTKEYIQHDPTTGFLWGLAGGFPPDVLPLIWESDCPSCKIDGYRVYRVDGGKRDAITTNKGTGAVLGKPADGFDNKCWAVTTYEGGVESELSKPYCVGKAALIATKSFSPAHMRCSQQFRSTSTHILGKSGPTETKECVGWLHPEGGIEGSKAVAAGYIHKSDVRLAGDTFWNAFERTGLHFDLSSLKGKTVTKARLRLTVRDSWQGSGYVNNHAFSCAAKIGVGKSYWWDHKDWIEASVWIDGGGRVGPEVSYDVAKIVDHWVRGATNTGFVLIGPEENEMAQTEGSCLTVFAPKATLEVEYF